MYAKPMVNIILFLFDIAIYIAILPEKIIRNVPRPIK